jgi:hypothetical protein
LPDRSRGLDAFVIARIGHLTAALTIINTLQHPSPFEKTLTDMRHIDDVFPQHLLNAAPAPRRCHETADYLDHLLDERPDLHGAALPYANHDELAELVMTRLWNRTRATDLEALADISSHEECDFWIALAILLRVFPDPQSDPALIALATHLVDRINAGTWRMRYSETPIVSPRGVELYSKLSEGRPELSLSEETMSRALAHAAWLARGQKTATRFAMFNGAPIWAANNLEID